MGGMKILPDKTASRKGGPKRVFRGGMVLPPIAGFVIVIGLAARATPPAMTVTQLNITNLQITITNAVPGHVYELYYSPNFDPGFVWNFFDQGTSGQTNFTVSMQFAPGGFFIALDGDDLDGDGIPNWQDADPKNPAVGALTVIIDSPTNGYTFR